MTDQVTRSMTGLLAFIFLLTFITQFNFPLLKHYQCTEVVEVSQKFTCYFSKVFHPWDNSHRFEGLISQFDKSHFLHIPGGTGTPFSHLLKSCSTVASLSTSLAHFFAPLLLPLSSPVPASCSFCLCH